MPISDQRQEELQPLAIRAYQLLTEGWPVDAILELYRESHLRDDEKNWIIENAKERYIGYTKYLKKINIDESKSALAIGVAVLVVILLFIYFVGWPKSGRGNGVFISAISLGAFAIIYAIWGWLNATPRGRRRDL